MTNEEIKQLFVGNIDQIKLMDIDAGTVIKTLMSELQRAGRNTYIRLKNATPDGHVVEYEFVEGDPSKVADYGNRLGLKTISETSLEVHSG